MAEIFMISPLMIKSKSRTRLERLKQGDDNTTGCLLAYQYFKYRYQLIAVNVSKQKELDAGSRAIQQIEFYGILKNNSHVCTVKRIDAGILQRNSKSSVNNING